MNVKKTTLLGIAAGIALSAVLAPAQTIEWTPTDANLWKTAAPADTPLPGIELRVSDDLGSYVGLMVHSEVLLDPPNAAPPTWLQPTSGTWTAHGAFNVLSAGTLDVDPEIWKLYAGLASVDVSSYMVPILTADPRLWKYQPPVWNDTTLSPDGYVSNEFWYSVRGATGKQSDVGVASLFRKAIHLRALAHNRPVSEAIEFLESEIMSSALGNGRPAFLRIQAFSTTSFTTVPTTHFTSHTEVDEPPLPAPVKLGPPLDIPLDLKTIPVGAMAALNGVFTPGQIISLSIPNLIPPATVYFTGSPSLVGVPVKDVSSADYPDLFEIQVPDAALPGPIYFDDGRDAPITEVGALLPSR